MFIVKVRSASENSIYISQSHYPEQTSVMFLQIFSFMYRYVIAHIDTYTYANTFCLLVDIFSSA